MATNNIKVSEILRHLRSRVEDESDLGFTKQQKLDALDSAQRYLCTVLHNFYLSNLETQEEISVTNIGKFNITELSQKVFRNDILSIDHMVEGSHYHIDKVEYNDLSRLSNTYLSGNMDYKMWYQFGDFVYIIPTNDVLWVQVSYIKEPAMFYDDSGSGENLGNCDLDMVLIDSLLDFAEAHLWKIDNKPNRVKLAFELGTSAVTLLNDRFAQERTTGVGQIGQGTT